MHFIAQQYKLTVCVGVTFQSSVTQHASATKEIPSLHSTPGCSVVFASLCSCHKATTFLKRSVDSQVISSLYFVFHYVGITIPTIFLSTSSCHSSDMKSHESSDQQPQIVSNYPYAYVRSPFHMESLQNQSQFHCSWLVEAAPNRTLRTVLQFEIATSIRLDLYDGPNEESPKIGSHSGKMDRLEWQTNSSHLYIRYSGSGRLVHSSSFKLYVEQSDPLVWCAKGAIQCRHGQKCVDLALQCDSVDDCGDGTDEQDCPNENVTFSKECGLTSEHLDGDASPLRIVGGVASLPGTSIIWSTYRF